MTNEELMLPRYKMIADFPQATGGFPSQFRVGDIFTYSFERTPFEPDYSWMESYPHLFKKLEWWEERKLDELPLFVTVNNSVYKIHHWHDELGLYPRFGEMGNIGKTPSVDWHFYKKDSKPATESEYNEYISKNAMKDNTTT